MIKVGEIRGGKGWILKKPSEDQHPPPYKMVFRFGEKEHERRVRKETKIYLKKSDVICYRR